TEVSLWDIRTRHRLAVLKRQRGLISRLAFDRTGKTLAWVSQPDNANDSAPPSVSLASEVRVWDVAGGRERAVLRGIAFHCADLAFSPDGKILALAGDVL